MSRSDLAVAHQAKAEADTFEAENAKALRAYQMRVAGSSWWDIAEALEVTEGQAASLLAQKIQAAAQLVDEGAKRHLLALEVERLDRLQEAMWDRALGGDTRAADTVLRIITTRAKILGLDITSSSAVTNNTIVVTGNTEQYIAALEAATTKDRYGN